MESFGVGSWTSAGESVCEGELGEVTVAWVSLIGGGEGRMDVGRDWGGAGGGVGGSAGGSMGEVGVMAGGLGRLAAWRGSGSRSCARIGVKQSC